MIQTIVGVDGGYRGWRGGTAGRRHVGHGVDHLCRWGCCHCMPHGGVSTAPLCRGLLLYGRLLLHGVARGVVTRHARGHDRGGGGAVGRGRLACEGVCASHQGGWGGGFGGGCEAHPSDTATTAARAGAARVRRLGLLHLQHTGKT